VGLFPQVLEEGTVPMLSKLFSVVVIDCSDKSVCFGLVGAGGSICIRRDCRIKSHMSSKSKFSRGNLSIVFIQRGVPGSVFVDPYLEAKGVPPDLLVRMGIQKPVAL
jgi:hypothetical protein